MTIYEIDSAMLECVDMETGEIIDIEKLESLEMQRDQKISNIACWIKELKAEANAVKAEKMNLEKRQNACNKKAEQLKNYLSYILAGEKFKDSKCSISYRRSEAVEVDKDIDLQRVPECYLKIERELKVSEVKEALKNGIEVTGCSLVEKQNIQIR